MKKNRKIRILDLWFQYGSEHIKKQVLIVVSSSLNLITPVG